MRIELIMENNDHSGPVIDICFKDEEGFEVGRISLVEMGEFAMAITYKKSDEGNQI